MSNINQNDFEVSSKSKNSEKLMRPRKYSVIFHNDNYTPMEFVVLVLREIFHKNHEEASSIMKEVHEKGKAVAGVFSFEIAEIKLMRTEAEATKNGFPLHLSLEPQEN